MIEVKKDETRYHKIKQDKINERYKRYEDNNNHVKREIKREE